MSQSIIRNSNSQRNGQSNEERIIDRVQVKPSNWIGHGRTVIARLWQRFCHDLDSRCYPVEREVTSPDPFRPTSLSGKQIADIWLLNSKR
jgi:hypothetical protein